MKNYELNSILAAALALPLLSCSGNQMGSPDSVWTPPLKQSVYLRGVYDDDPSDNLGRFVKRGLANGEIDESNAFPSRCSKFFTTKVVGSGGTFDETFTASSSASASFGVEKLGKAKGSYGSNSEMRVKYTLKKVMRAVVDVDKRSQCCGTDGSQCSDKYIAEFYMGDGEAYQFLGSQAAVGASGTYGVYSGDVDYKNGSAWKRVTTFKDVYFAYKTALVGTGSDGPANTDVCGGNWASIVPESLDGKFFAGISKPAGSEQAARQDAAQDARLQTVQYIGVKLAQARVQTSKNLDAIWTDESAVSAAAEGVAQMVKDRCWAPLTQVDGPTWRGQIKGLFFFPNSEIYKAQGAIADKLKAAGKISAADAAAIKAAPVVAEPAP